LPEYVAWGLASSAPALSRHALRFARARNFERFVLAVATPARHLQSPKMTVAAEIHNAPLAWVEAMESTSVGDPVVHAFLRGRNLPMCWGRQLFEACGAGARWALQAPFGFASGASAVARHVDGAVMIFTVARPEQHPHKPASIALQVDANLFAHAVLDGATRGLLAAVAGTRCERRSEPALIRR
jgi:hypothetical protein